MGGPGSGRLPKPSSAKSLAGNPGERPVMHNPSGPSGFPEPPEWLWPEALAEWQRIRPALEPMGIITLADRNAVAAYCQAFALYLRASASIAEEGFIVEGHRGVTSKNPAVQIQRDAVDQMNRWGAKLGLSPSDRARLGAVVDETAEGPDADVLRLLTGG